MRVARGNSNDLHPKYLTTPTASTLHSGIIIIIIIIIITREEALATTQLQTRRLAIFESGIRFHRVENSINGDSFASKRGWKPMTSVLSSSLCMGTNFIGHCNKLKWSRSRISTQDRCNIRMYRVFCRSTIPFGGISGIWMWKWYSKIRSWDRDDLWINGDQMDI